MEKTRYPGVYVRPNGSFAFTWRDRTGKQRWGTAPNAKTGARLKAEAEQRATRGEQEASSQALLAALAEWVDVYQGTGRRGFREDTRAEYRQLIDTTYREAFTASEKVRDLTPQRVAMFVAWCVRQGWADQTIRNKLTPLRSACATWVREGILPSNPTQGAALPHRPRVEDDEPRARPLTLEQVQVLLAHTDVRYRLLVRFMVETGLRVSELGGLETRHVRLASGSPAVLVRQRLRDGALDVPKTRYSRRDLPLSLATADELAELVRGRAQKAPVWTLPRGGRVTPQSAKQLLKPGLAEADASWAGWHALRHTCASILFSQGRNIVQVQRWLGHHSPSFTLDRYVHLLDPGDLGEALDLRPVVPSALSV